MGVIQANAVNPESLVLGAALIEASFDSGSTFAGLGLNEGESSFQIEQTPLDQTPANGVKYQVLEGVASESATASFNLFELDKDIINKLNGGVGKYTAVAGTPVTGASQTISGGNWEYEKPVEFNVISTVKPTVTACVGSVDGTLVEDTDYFIRKASRSYMWTIVVIDSVTVTTEAQDITITFNYTPKKSEVLTGGGGTNQSNVALRFTNKSEYPADAAVATQLGITVGEGYHKVTVMTLWKGVQTNGFGLSFKTKDATDPGLAPSFEFRFENDVTRPIKERLYRYETYNAVLS